MGIHAAEGRLTSATFSTTRSEGSRSFGSFAVETLREVGVDLFAWQADTIDEWLEVDEAGHLTRGTCGLIVPRRNGKTALILARVLFGMMFLDESRWIYSAHRMDTAREAFDDMRRLCRHPLIEPRVSKVHLAHGKEAIEFHDGARFAIRTRTGHGGRGMECDGLVIDEALELDDDSVAALTPLTARAAAGGRGQVIYASSAGHTGSEVLGRLRDRGRLAHGTDGGGLSYREFAADRGDSPDDPEAWARANPSLGTGILSERFLSEARGRMSAEAFGREHLGWWSDSEGLPAIDPDAWAALATRSAPERADGAVWLAFDLAPDRLSARVLGFYRADDGRIAVSVVDALDDPNGIDGDAYANRVVAIAQAHDPEVIGFDRLTGDHVAQVLSNHGWKSRLRPVTGAKVANGCGSLLAAVRLGQVAHDGNPVLADDLGRAVPKPFGDGAWLFSRKAVTSGPIAGAVALAIGFYLSADELVV